MTSLPMKRGTAPPLLLGARGLVSQSSSLTDPPDLVDALGADRAAPSKGKPPRKGDAVSGAVADGTLSTSPVTASAGASPKNAEGKVGGVASSGGVAGKGSARSKGPVAPASLSGKAGLRRRKNGSGSASGAGRASSDPNWSVDDAGAEARDISGVADVKDLSPLRARPRSKRRAAAAAAAASAAQANRPTRSTVAAAVGAATPESRSRPERKRSSTNVGAGKSPGAVPQGTGTTPSHGSSAPGSTPVGSTPVVPGGTTPLNADEDDWVCSSDEEEMLQEEIAKCLRPKTEAQEAEWAATMEEVANRPPPRSNTRAQTALNSRSRGAAAHLPKMWWQRTEVPFSQPAQRKGVELRLTPAEIAADMEVFSGGVVSAAASSATASAPASGRRTPRGGAANGSNSSSRGKGVKRRRRGDDVAAGAGGGLGNAEKERKRAKGSAAGGDGRMFVKHAEKKGWVVCRKCRTAVWPPNCAKHLACCSKSSA